MLNSGYVDYSMSVNAWNAYENGEMPISQWKKVNILEALEKAYSKAYSDIAGKYPLKILKDTCLECTSWHHTSKFFTETDFYSVREDIESVEQLVSELEANAKKAAVEKAKKKNPVTYRCEAEYDEWEGTRNYGRFKTYKAVGTIVGNWFHADGSKKKKSVLSEHFRIIKKLEE